MTLGQWRASGFRLLDTVSLNVPDALRLALAYSKLRRLVAHRSAHLRKNRPPEISALGPDKYLDIDYWVLETLCRVFRLHLHRDAKPLRILDLGTGMGYFPFACKQYGHDVEAVDLPGCSLYEESVEVLEIARRFHRIDFETGIGTAARYDLITGFMICFNGHATPAVWGAAEWRLFLSRTATHNLTDEGRVFLSFNREGPGEILAKPLRRLFDEMGASIRRNEVSLAKTGILRVDS